MCGCVCVCMYTFLCTISSKNTSVESFVLFMKLTVPKKKHLPLIGLSVCITGHQYRICMLHQTSVQNLLIPQNISIKPVHTDGYQYRTGTLSYTLVQYLYALLDISTEPAHTTEHQYQACTRRWASVQNRHTLLDIRTVFVCYARHQYITDTL